MRLLKRLELGWKRFWLAVICGVIRVTGRAPKPLDNTAPLRVLFLRPDRIGDAIVSTGFFRELTTQRPNVSLDVLCSVRNAAALENDPHLGVIHVLDKRGIATFPALARSLRAARYDAVIDCMVTAPSMTCMLLMLASGARHRIGIAGRGVDAALTIPVAAARDKVHIIDLLARFGSVFGIDEDSTDWRPELHPGPAAVERAGNAWAKAPGENRNRILLNVSAGKPSRNWPDEYFRAAVEHFRSRSPDAKVLMMGAPGEWERVERLAEFTRVEAVPTPRLDDAIALVASATFLLTPDTSVAHMASAAGTPAVVMYLKGTAAMWALYGAPGANLESRDSTLATLPLPEVLAAIDNVMEALPVEAYPSSRP